MKEVEYWKSTQLESYPNEEWKSLDFMGYPNYEVSNLGRVKSLERQVWCEPNQDYSIRKERILRQELNKKGYPQIVLHNNKHKKTYTVHRLVALAFIPNPNNKPEIDHQNCIRHCNIASNLSWVSSQENKMNPLTRKHLSEAMVGLRAGEKAPWYGKLGKDSPSSIPIIQLSKTGKFIKQWDSTADVERELGIIHQNISKVLYGKRHSAGGYFWKWA